MTVVSGNIRRMWIFVGAPLAGVSNEMGLSTTAVFGDLSGYFFGTFIEKASDII